MSPRNTANVARNRRLLPKHKQIVEYLIISRIEKRQLKNDVYVRNLSIKLLRLMLSLKILNFQSGLC